MSASSNQDLTMTNIMENKNDDLDDWLGEALRIEAARTQADHLPPIPVTFTELSNPLHTAHQFDDWDEDIRAVLAREDLTDIIDMNTSRPRENHSNIKAWEQLSMAVAQWLKDNISSSLLRQLERTEQAISFADETYTAIMKEVDEERKMTDYEMLVACWNMNPDSFFSASEYVEDFIHAAARLVDRDMEIPPYAILLRIIDGLGQANLLALKDKMIDKLQQNEDTGSNFTRGRLQEYVNMLQGELRIEEITRKP
ncbi:hypothetical protein N7493_008799 [Penicillium malachiteum]|uniref:Uncharacterized protein n=1 Tax=Penicillium malachiteum TaxID=1324776 RepID=A0AAD6HFG3_9EURO|nr:hypothetical protein N7493_008799 [Penicillium malachiteum]